MPFNLAGAAGGAQTGAQVGGIFGPEGAAIGGILGGVTGLFGLGGGSDPGAAQRMVDPYAPYRASAAEQLNDLMLNPSSVTSLPGYDFMQARGQQGVERAMAARGLTMSTNELNALRESDQDLAYKMYNDQYNKLVTLSGAGQSPATGGATYLNQERQNQMDQYAGLGGLSSIFNSFQSTATGSSTTLPNQGTDTNSTVGRLMTTPSIGGDSYQYPSMIPGVN